MYPLWLTSSITRRLQFNDCSSVMSFVLVGVLVFAVAESSPSVRIVKREAINDKVLNYLSTFGYLPPSDIETGNLRTDEQLKDAIKTLQKFGNIPATGEVDEKTTRLLRSPRCGLPDVQSPEYSRRKKRYVLQGQKWHHTNLTWSLQSRYIHNLDINQIRRILHKALNVWSKHSRITFQETSSDDADILIYFEKGYHNDGFPFDGRGQILAHAFFPGTGRGGDAHFDEEETWNLDIDKEARGSTNLFAVAAHEFGHSLGLSHSSVSGSLMFPWYQGLKANFELPEDDRDAIQVLYGPKDTSREDRYPTRAPERPPYRPPPYAPPHYPPPRVYPPYQPNDNPKPSSPTEPPRYNPPTTTPPKRYPSSPPSHRPVDSVPNTCDTSYDAVSVIRGELFIFKDKYIWRINDRGLSVGYPASIDRLWHKLPANLTHVDAVYERNDRKIVFFVGREIYVFEGNILQNGYPRSLTSLGLPRSLDRIDAAFVWGYNSKTYFFNGSMYWRFDDEVGRVELDYPRPIANVWKGVPDNIDAAFQWNDGATYFFKGKGFWKFDDRKMRVTHRHPMLSAPIWMGCPKALEDPSSKEDERQATDKVLYIPNVSEERFLPIPLLTIIIAVALLVLVLSVILMIVVRRKTQFYLRLKRFVI